MPTLANPWPPRASRGEGVDQCNEPRELHGVVDGEFREAQDEVFLELPPEEQSSPELQLVLDPEFL